MNFCPMNDGSSKPLRRIRDSIRLTASKLTEKRAVKSSENNDFCIQIKRLQVGVKDPRGSPSKSNIICERVVTHATVSLSCFMCSICVLSCWWYIISNTDSIIIIMCKDTMKHEQIRTFSEEYITNKCTHQMADPLKLETDLQRRSPQDESTDKSRREFWWFSDASSIVLLLVDWLACDV
jgi:hypothetical protein